LVLEVNVDKTNYRPVFVSSYQSAGKNGNMINNEYFENVATLKYFRKTVRKQNYIRDGVKCSEFFLSAWWSCISSSPYVFMAWSLLTLGAF
jgi:hypothetical protein